MGEWRNEDASESSSQDCTMFRYCTAARLTPQPKFLATDPDSEPGQVEHGLNTDLIAAKIQKTRKAEGNLTWENKGTEDGKKIV
jgi:hypothetical protein